jgi:hypothetical protein
MLSVIRLSVMAPKGIKGFVASAPGTFKCQFMLLRFAKIIGAFIDIYKKNTRTKDSYHLHTS